MNNHYTKVPGAQFICQADFLPAKNRTIRHKKYYFFDKISGNK